MTNKEIKQALKELPQWRCTELPELEDKANARHAKQVATKGYSNYELWSLDSTIARFIYPRLKAFRKGYVGVPGPLVPENEDDKQAWKIAEAEWRAILDAMIFAFGQIASGNYYELAPPVKQTKRRKQLLERIEFGLDLFRKYFHSLWW